MQPNAVRRTKSYVPPPQPIKTAPRDESFREFFVRKFGYWPGGHYSREQYPAFMTDLSTALDLYITKRLETANGR